MSVESVREDLRRRAADLAVIETTASTATVAQAADVHGVEPGQIAKTLCLDVGGRIVLVVASGIARLDNGKLKAAFGGKPRLCDAQAVLEATGHPVGGVCPFGLATPLPVYCDVSLRRFAQVLPAAGAANAAVRIDTGRLAQLTGAQWVDVCRGA